MTQRDAELKFIELCEEFIRRSKEIDDHTPWSDVEPKWWFKMMDMQRAAYSALPPKRED